MLPNNLCRKLFFSMLRVRMVEEAIAAEYKKQEMRCPVHLCIGQEAIPAGICAHLSPKDAVLSNHRSHGHYLAKGGSLKGMIAEIYGKQTGCSMGRGGSQHLIDLSVNFYGSTPIVGGTIPVATGIAWVAKLKGEKKITAVFFGDAATEEGVFHESLNFASLHKLPVLFICENNSYSILTPISDRQPQRKISALASSYGLLSINEDGNDLIKVYLSGRKAADHIRRGRGPVFIEYRTYRQREHCGPGFDPAGCRPEEEITAWKSKDPVTGMEKYLRANNISSSQQLADIRKKIGKEIEAAFRYARESPFPKEIPQEAQTYA